MVALLVLQEPFPINCYKGAHWGFTFRSQRESVVAYFGNANGPDAQQVDDPNWFTCYNLLNGACCPPGYYGEPYVQTNLQGAKCTKCPDGLYQPWSRSSKCLGSKCMPGMCSYSKPMYTDNGLNIRTGLPLQSASDRIPVPFEGGAVTQLQAVCTPCEGGWWNDGVGGTRGRGCGVGYYGIKGATNEASAKCVRCPAGQTNFGNSSTCTGNICPAGSFYYSQDTVDKMNTLYRGIFSQDTSQEKKLLGTCVPCVSGMYTDKPGMYECLGVPCGKLFYGVGNSTSRLNGCSPCPGGQSGLNSFGNVKCMGTMCQPGQYASNATGGICKPCPFGTYSDSSGVLECKKMLQCPSETFMFPVEGGATSMNDTRACRIASPGFYLDTTQNTLKRCADGAVSCSSATSDAPTTSLLVRGRLPSTFNSNNKTCRLCLPGTYVDKAQKEFCIPCPHSTFGSTTVIRISDENPLSGITVEYQISLDRSSCTRCDIGYFNDISGSVSSYDAKYQVSYFPYFSDNPFFDAYIDKATGALISCQMAYSL